jgi:hypothetical protein
VTGVQTCALPIFQPKGNRTTLGNLPPVYACTESRTLEGGVGYLRISVFLDPGSVMDHVAKAVQSFHEAPGIVLDLRGNMGGLGAMAMGVAGWFVPEKGKKLGTMIMRGNQLNFTIMPRPETYDGKLAILVDGGSASTTEILAAGLQDQGRARVFGTRSAGAALPSGRGCRVIVKRPMSTVAMGSVVKFSALLSRTRRAALSVGASKAPVGLLRRLRRLLGVMPSLWAP